MQFFQLLPLCLSEEFGGRDELEMGEKVLVPETLRQLSLQGALL